MTRYAHTQTAPLYLLLLAVSVGQLIGAVLLKDNPAVFWLLVATASAIAVLALMFKTLTVSDEGDHLSVRFGPLPGFHRNIDYADITAVEPSRSSLIDGWGIHYVPGRGWTYNLWGYDCVKLTVGEKTIRIGTDDPAGLAEFLEHRLLEETVPIS